ncbi:ABC transporter permease [Actinokineospora auranticolor]|uniref:Putative ABC transport system permease protein n=1 Tax=Actinokineospora auranticolor TaxID=155976 RepID=A0A2S6GCG1_9PSEU|nr:ABC transporter permease [Actinokineospora auranticolor]PPK62408.1 putative ABC transport system permease protein [Actinokineospora auranticolor]
MALSGRFRSALVIGGQGIRARKLRTFLSMVSLFLGVLAVVTVQAGSVLANRALLADIELTAGKDGTIQVSLQANPEQARLVREVLADQSGVVAVSSFQATVGEPGLTPINPGATPLKWADQGSSAVPMFCDNQGRCMAVSDGPVAPRGQAIEVQLVGLSGDIRSFRPFQVESGSWLDFAGAPSLSPGLVLNREAALAFRQYQVPAEMRLGASMGVGGPSGTANSTPHIVGTVHDGQQFPTVYVRSDELAMWTPQETGDQYFSLYLSPSGEPVVQRLEARLNALGAHQPLYRNVVNAREHIGAQLDLMSWIFLGMAALVLLIGVAGILNVGLATVGERVEEFALRRAVGMPRLLLGGVVLAETLIIGLLTAGAAVGAGALGLQLVSSMFGSRRPELQGVQFPWEAGVAGVAAGVAAGVLGGLLPAIRAARIPIATVMRA